jgi:hypothetical protein
MIYEDFATGLRAKQTFDHLIRELGSKFVFHSKLWKLDILQLPHCGKIAAADVRVADLIIIAAHGRTGFPAGVKSWIDRWLATVRPRPRALVSLVDDRTETLTNSSTTCAYLREVAARGRMDYFGRESDPPNQEAGFPFEKLCKQADRKSLMMQEILRQTTPHTRWGINE